MSADRKREPASAEVFEPFWNTFACFDPASVVDLIGSADRDVAQAEARRLAWIATRHDQVIEAWEQSTTALSQEAEGRRFTDAMDQLVGEVGAALGRGASAARGAIELGVALRDRLPRVFECLYEGLIGLMAARTVVRRCEAVTDQVTLHRIDCVVAAGLVRRVRQTGVLTENEVKRLVDRVLAELDPDAVPTPASSHQRGLWFEARRDGLADLAGVLLVEDAAALERRIDEVAATVCRADPRTTGERHADALVALVEGYSSLGCRCTGESCANRERVSERSAVESKSVADVTIVISEATLAGVDDAPVLVGDQVVSAHVGRDVISRVGEARFEALGTVSDPAPEVVSEVVLDVGAAAAGDAEDAPPSESPPEPQPGSPPGTSRGLRSGPRPGPRSGPRLFGHHIAGYRPSRLQIRFLRIRYPACVFPGCAVRFGKCQLDHVRERNHRDPAAGGHTRVENLVPLCGRHHRIKTEQDWLSDVLPDGSVQWHSPTGHVYRTGLVPGDDLFELDAIEWREPVRATAEPKPADAPSFAERRSRVREARRVHYRRERERLRAENPDDPRWDDSPPPY